MATASLTEFSEMTTVSSGLLAQCGDLSTATVQTPITFSTSTQSAAFGSKTRFVRVVVDADAFFAYGANPTATTNGIPISANTPEYFAVKANDKLAFVAAA